MSRAFVEMPRVLNADGSVRRERGLVEMDVLGRDELDLVRPRFRALVEEEWAAGRDVPRSVITLNDRPPTEDEIEFARNIERSP